MFLKLPFAVSFSVLFFTIQYAVFRKSFRTFYVSLYICNSELAFIIGLEHSVIGYIALFQAIIALCK